MTYTEMLETLKKLTLPERLALMEAALHLMREELQQHAQPPATDEKTARLAAAAQALLPDYTTDTELTSFTAIDGPSLRRTHDQSIW
jgi:hypothetical protein